MPRKKWRKTPLVQILSRGERPGVVGKAHQKDAFWIKKWSGHHSRPQHDNSLKGGKIMLASTLYHFFFKRERGLG